MELPVSRLIWSPCSHEIGGSEVSVTGPRLILVDS